MAADDTLTQISVLAFQRLRVYTQSCPSEPVDFLFRARIVPAAPNWPIGVLGKCYHGFWQYFFQTPLRGGARRGRILEVLRENAKTLRFE
ncbi:MAG: hypothetical protein WB763_10440 [Terriglobia bacterium]|jgi:hypothetical protein